MKRKAIAVAVAASMILQNFSGAFSGIVYAQNNVAEWTGDSDVDQIIPEKEESETFSQKEKDQTLSAEELIEDAAPDVIDLTFDDASSDETESETEGLSLYLDPEGYEVYFGNPYYEITDEEGNIKIVDLEENTGTEDVIASVANEGAGNDVLTLSNQYETEKDARSESGMSEHTVNETAVKETEDPVQIEKQTETSEIEQSLEVARADRWMFSVSDAWIDTPDRTERQEVEIEEGRLNLSDYDAGIFSLFGFELHFAEENNAVSLISPGDVLEMKLPSGHIQYETTEYAKLTACYGEDQKTDIGTYSIQGDRLILQFNRDLSSLHEGNSLVMSVSVSAQIDDFYTQEATDLQRRQEFTLPVKFSTNSIVLSEERWILHLPSPALSDIAEDMEETEQEIDFEEMTEAENDTAEAGTDFSREWGYNLNQDKGRIELLYYRGKGGDVSVPSEAVLEGKTYPIYIASSGLFRNFSEEAEWYDEDDEESGLEPLNRKPLTSVTFPDTPIEACEDALLEMFEYNESLKSVDNLDALSGNNLKNASYAFYSTGLVNAPDLPDTIENIDYAFAYCTSLKKAGKLPSAVTRMEYTYEGDTSLTEAPVLPKNLEYEESIFMDCTSLTKAPTLPGSLKTMWGMFHGCSALKTAPTLPDGIELINSSFWGCISLKEAPMLPSSLRYMAFAFQNCTALTVMPKLPAKIRTINSTFSGCTALTTATNIPSECQSLVFTFRNCSSLQGSITITTPGTPRIHFDNSDGGFGFGAWDEYQHIREWYEYAFTGAATKGSGLTVNYCVLNEDEIDKVIATKSSNSKIVKGKRVEIDASYAALLRKNTAQVLVTDRNNNPIDGATVQYGRLSSERTGKNGRVELTYSEADLAGVTDLKNATAADKEQMHKLTVSAMGYLSSIEDMELSKDGYPNHITLYQAGEEGIKKLSLKYEGKNYNLLTQGVTIGVQDTNAWGASLVAELTCEPKYGAKDQYDYTLYQGNRTWKSGDGTFSISAKEFTGGQPAKLLLQDRASGQNIGTKTLSLEFVDSLVQKGEFVLGNALSITIPDSVPGMGGKVIKLGQIKCPLEVTLEGTPPNQKMKVGINMGVAKRTWNNGYGENRKSGKWEETMSKLTTWDEGIFSIDKYQKYLENPESIVANSAGVTVSMKMGGYFEGAVSDWSSMFPLSTNWKNARNLSGGVYVEGSIKIATEMQFQVLVVPVVVAIEGSGKGKLTLKNTSFANADASSNLDLTASLLAFAGVGIANVASAGIYGEGKSIMKFLLATTTNEKGGLKEWSLKGNMGVMVRFMGDELGRYSFLNGTYTIISRSKAAMKKTAMRPSAVETLEEAIMASLQNADSAVEMDRDYLAERTDWNENLDFDYYDERNEIMTFQRNTYQDIQPHLYERYMFWVDDLGEGRDAANRTAVVFSRQIEHENWWGNSYYEGWSSPVAIDDDGTADYDLNTSEDADYIYLVWKNAKEPLDGTETLSEKAKKMELKVARLNKATGETEILGTVTDNETAEYEPSVRAGTDGISVTWYENSEDQLFGLSGTNLLRRAVYDGGRWIVDETNAQTALLLYKEELYLGGQRYTAILEDQDSDLTTNDQQLCLIGAEGKKTALSTAVTGVPQSAMIFGQSSLCWAEGNELKYISEQGQTPRTLVTCEQLLTNRYLLFGDEAGNMSILYLGNAGSGTQALFQQYDRNIAAWSEAELLEIEDGKYIEDASGYYNGSSINLVFRQTSVENAEESIENWTFQSDFCCMEIYGVSDPVIEEVVYDDEGIEPGDRLHIAVSIKNNGARATDGLYLRIVSPDGGNLVLQELPAISGSEPFVFETDITVSDDETLQIYSASLCRYDEDWDEDDEDEYGDAYSIVGESVRFAVGAGQLRLDAERVDHPGEDELVFRITNNGLERLGGTLRLRNAENEEEIYKEIAIPRVGREECFAVTYDEYQLFERSEESHYILAELEYPNAEDVDEVNARLIYTRPGICRVTLIRDGETVSEKKEQRGEPVQVPESLSDQEWFLDEELTLPWNPEDPVTEDITLYASPADEKDPDPNALITYERSEGTLVINGSGEMEDFNLTTNKAPWNRESGNVEKIVLSEEITRIGAYAFVNSSASEILIGKGVSQIGEYAFKGCSELCTITLPDNLTKIEEGLFAGCTVLTELSVPEHVTEIGAWAFADCTSLKKLTIPATSERIGNGAFARCTGLSEVTVLSRTAVFGEDVFTGTDRLILRGYAGSTAETYAKAHGITFTALDKKTEIKPQTTPKQVVSPHLTVNAISLKMCFKQKNAKLKATLLPGDRIVSATSDNEKIVKASVVGTENVKLTAKKKKGKANVTIRTAMGQSATVAIQVQKKKVKTSAIAIAPAAQQTVTLKKGTSLSLEAEMLPITSQDKLTFQTSSKKVASVSKKGIVKAKKLGKATITIKAGKKKKKVKIVVVP